MTLLLAVPRCSGVPHGRIGCRAIKLGFPLYLSDFNSPCRPSGLPRQGLSRFWSRCFQQRWEGAVFTSGGSATAGDIILSLDSADTFPFASLSRHRNLLRSASRLSRWRRRRCDPPQHAAKQPPGQMPLGQQQPVVAGVLDQSGAIRRRSLQRELLHNCPYATLTTPT